MCAVNFAAKKLVPARVLGLDPFCPQVDHDDDNDAIQQNMGKKECIHLDPSVSSWGEIPTFCCCSENGSIMAKLLTQMLKTIDNHDVFNQPKDVSPFLHGS